MLYFLLIDETFPEHYKSCWFPYKSNLYFLNIETWKLSTKNSSEFEEKKSFWKHVLKIVLGNIFLRSDHDG